MDRQQMEELPSFDMYFSYAMLDLSAAAIGCSVDKILDVGVRSGEFVMELTNIKNFAKFQIPSIFLNKSLIGKSLTLHLTQTW